MDDLAAAHYERLTTSRSGIVLSKALPKDVVAMILIRKEILERKQLMSDLRNRGSKRRNWLDMMKKIYYYHWSERLFKDYCDYQRE
jgi:hypothetical protein